MFRYVVAAACLTACLTRASADDRLLEGFEDEAQLKTTGKVAVIAAIDAVTEGKKALQLFPGAVVTIKLPAKSANPPGWLKIDTFLVQPAVAATLRLGIPKVLDVHGYVGPGKDTLALPLGLAARTDRAAWPAEELQFTIQNAGKDPVVIDNIRLSEPAAAPKGAVLLDFGPANQVLWPGFDPVFTQGADITWLGDEKVTGYALPYPDPLLGDFCGLEVSYRQTTSMNLTSAGGGPAYIWLTHYSYAFSQPLECVAKLNDVDVFHQKLTPQQMLGLDGLLEGKDQAWTADWLSKTFVPHLVTRLEVTLKPGVNALILANCQVAAVAMAPKTEAVTLKKCVEGVEDDLKRYRRQFVLGAQARPWCDVAPSDEETKAGLMVFDPPPDQWFDRNYSPTAEQKATELHLVAGGGGSALAAVAVVPTAESGPITMTVEPPRDAKGMIPPGDCMAYAVEDMPVVRDGAVYYQPYLPAKSVRPAGARTVVWFAVRIRVPEHTDSGVLRGQIRIASGANSVRVPIELKVAKAPAGAPLPPATWATGSNGDCFEPYRCLRNALLDPKPVAVGKDILARLAEEGFNASMMPGPDVSERSLDINIEGMTSYLKNHLRIESTGKTLVNTMYAVRGLQNNEVQPGTGKYIKVATDFIHLAMDTAGKGGLKNYVVCLGQLGEMKVWQTLLPLLRAAAGPANVAGAGRLGVSVDSAALAALTKDDRDLLYKNVDMLICRPSGKDALGPLDDFKKLAPEKTVLLWLETGDAYGAGFYCWAVGADGAVVGNTFSGEPAFNAFAFSGNTMLVMNAQGGFEPTLNALMLAQGIDDYDLARRCEAAVKPARARGFDVSALEKALGEIRLGANAQPPGFDRALARPAGVEPAKLIEWRAALVDALAKLGPSTAPAGGAAPAIAPASAPVAVPAK